MNVASRIAVPAGRHIPAGAGRAVPFPLHPISQLVAGSDLPANVSLWEVEIPAKSPGAPPHIHTHEDEIYVVLEGEMTFLIGEEVVTAGPGSTVALPRGGLHATWNAGDAPVRALTFVSQDSAFEHFFDRVVARVAEEGAASPAEAAGIVGAVAAEIGVAIHMDKLPEPAKPFFGGA